MKITSVVRHGKGTAITVATITTTTTTTTTTISGTHASTTCREKLRTKIIRVAEDGEIEMVLMIVTLIAKTSIFKFCHAQMQQTAVQ